MKKFIAKLVISSWFIVHNLVIILLLFVYLQTTNYQLPTILAAESNICCSKGFFLNPDDNKCYAPEDPDDPTGAGDRLVGDPKKCEVNELCIPTLPPTCQKTAEGVFGQIPLPGPIANIPGLTGAAKLSSVLSTGIVLLYIFGSIAFVFMIVWAAIRWITSGGDKEAVASARKRITWAIIGLILLSLAFLIIGIIGNITGFSLFQGNELIPAQQVEMQRQEILRAKQAEDLKKAENEKRAGEKGSVSPPNIQRWKLRCTKDIIEGCSKVGKLCTVENDIAVCREYSEICTRTLVKECDDEQLPQTCYVEFGKPFCR